MWHEVASGFTVAYAADGLLPFGFFSHWRVALGLASFSHCNTFVNRNRKQGTKSVESIRLFSNDDLLREETNNVGKEVPVLEYESFTVSRTFTKNTDHRISIIALFKGVPQGKRNALMEPLEALFSVASSVINDVPEDEVFGRWHRETSCSDLFPGEGKEHIYLDVRVKTMCIKPSRSAKVEEAANDFFNLASEIICG